MFSFSVAAVGYESCIRTRDSKKPAQLKFVEDPTSTVSKPQT